MDQELNCGGTRPILTARRAISKRSRRLLVRGVRDPVAQVLKPMR
jgi:hypothetical protein